MERNSILTQLLIRYSNLSHLDKSISKAAEIIIKVYKNGGKILVGGNGGSSSDADHIVGEFMKCFELKRPLKVVLQEKLKKLSPEWGEILGENLQQGLPAISLSAHTSLVTAISNDLGGEFIFAQQVTGYGNPGDALMVLSTSGNSQDVINSLIIAKAKGLKTIGMTGQTGGKMKEFCDVLINVPETRTAFVQELHIPVYHALCLMVEAEMFNS